MQGLPASGKSTRAEELLREMGNAVRINKDLLRTMLHFDNFTGKNEGLTRDAARTLAKTFLSKNLNVIIDDTNLNEGTLQSWKDLGMEAGAKIEIIDLTDVNVQECVYRDSLREKQVGGTVIKNMALRAGILNFTEKNVVLCDIDGTIADTTHRLHYVTKPEGAPDDWKKDWKGFFSEMGNDGVRRDVQKMLIELYNQGKTIIFMSARPESYKEVTLKWLADNNLSFAYTLIMRRTNDKRPDTETKREMFEQHFPDKSVIHTVFDDRPSVVRLWQEMGLNVVDVGAGIEF